MKKALFIVIFLTFAIISGLFAADSSSSSSLVDSVAIISDYSGESRINQDGKWTNVSLNMPVYEGAEFSTKTDSFIEITFDDATIVRLDENSNLKLSEMKRDKDITKTIFNLTIGKLLAVVDKLRDQDSTFEVHTKMAIAAVKGTELGIEVLGDETLLGVFDGTVDYGQPGKFIKVLKGMESGAGNDGMTGSPEDMKHWLKYRARIETMREEIRIVRELKKEGRDAVIRWRINKKNKETGQESETKATLGGIDKEDTKKAENRIQDILKQKVRKELRNLREHAREDLKYVRSEMKADFHLGKTMMDVHGNRVRLEEYVFRPAKNEVNLLSLTFRQSRLDYLRYRAIFNTDLPKLIPAVAWNSDWYVFAPKYYRTSEILVLSNTVDRIQTATAYDFNNNGGAAAPSHWWISENGGNIRISNKNTGQLETVLSWETINGTRTYTGGTGVTSVAPSLKPAASGDELAWVSSDKYNNGNVLTTKTYLIDDYGQVKKVPGTIPDAIDILFNTNVEMQFTYSDAQGNSLFEFGDIDVISKILWWTALSPRD